MSRYRSFEHPVTLEQDMVFAIETYWPTPDGSAAARIEEEVVVTGSGCELLTRFPPTSSTLPEPSCSPQ